jgi:AraC-like DNA-binding protein
VLFDFTIAVGPLRPLAAQLEALGVDASAFLSGRGIDPGLLADREARIPIWKLLGIWEAAAEAAEDPYFGLHAAARAERSTFGVVSDLVQAHATLGDALKQLIRYLGILTQTVSLELVDASGFSRLRARFRMPPQAQGLHAVEFTLASLHHFAATSVGPRFALREVSFRHLNRAPLPEYQRVFGAPARFGFGSNHLEFDAAALALPLLSFDPERARALDATAHKVLLGLPQGGELTPRVCRLAMGQLRAGEEPTLEHAARGIHSSARSVQRGLKREGAGFAQLVDRLRRGLALFYIDDPRLSLSDVGFLVGFSEPAAFHRAFKRWVGCTPGKYRGG